MGGAGRGFWMAVGAAALFGLSAPLSKPLLANTSPLALTSLLYSGCGLAAGIAWLAAPHGREAPLARTDLPWLLGSIAAGGVAAPVLLLVGLTSLPASTVSLALSCEAAATALLAALLFKEGAGLRLWMAVALVTAGCAVLNGLRAASPVVAGLAAVVGACILWGLDNNLTGALSHKNPLAITAIKGSGAGLVSAALAAATGAAPPPATTALAGLAIGALCYGTSLVLFTGALRRLGAARTAALFAAAPFLGALASVALLGERLAPSGWAAGGLMLAALLLLRGERHSHGHTHAPLEHDHRHRHDDGHHEHAHAVPASGEHAHPHSHPGLSHVHPHAPDTHHRHGHA